MLKLEQKETASSFFYTEEKTMGAISNDWLAPLSGEFKKPYYRELYNTVMSEYRSRVIYPDANDIFNAFDFTPLSKVKVVR